jgi:hypothetical protein
MQSQEQMKSANKEILGIKMKTEAQHSHCIAK